MKDYGITKDNTYIQGKQYIIWAVGLSK